MGAKAIIGQVEQVSFPELNILNIHARIDTGATSSAIWAVSANVTDAGLEVVFLGSDTDWYTGTKHVFTEYDEVNVKSSMGNWESRFKIPLLVVIGKKHVRAWFTLANRSLQVYPVLIGRNVLQDTFLVDVTMGTALHEAVLSAREKALEQQHAKERGNS